MCIDAPETTTNSRSSGLRVDAGRHLFSESEKNVALSLSLAPLIFGFTRWIGFGMSVPFRRIDFGGVMSWNTQPNCRASDDWRLDEFCPNFLSLFLPGFSGRSWHWSVTSPIFLPITLFQYSHCTFVILFGPSCRLFINLTMCIRALLTKFATTLCLVEQAFWRVPFFTKWVIASSCEVISLQGHRDILPLGLLPLGLRVLDAFRSFCCMKEFGDGFDWCNFSTLIDYRGGNCNCLLFTHCPLVIPLPTISKNSLYTLFCLHGFLTTPLLLIIPTSWSQNSYFEFLARYFFSP